MRRNKRCICGKKMKIYTKESVTQRPPLIWRFWKCVCGEEITIEINPA